MTTSLAACRLGIAVDALLIVALLAAACTSDDAIDVSPAKPNDHNSTVAELDGDDQPASSQPGGDARSSIADEPGHNSPSNAEPNELNGSEPEQPTSSQPGGDANDGDARSSSADEPGRDSPSNAEPSEPNGSEPEQPAPLSANGWTRLSPIADLLHVETSPHGAAIVAGGHGEGMLSGDGGVTWNRIDWPGDARSKAFVDPSGKVISVAGSLSASGLEDAAYRSEDGGASWEEVLLDTPALGWFVLDSFLHGVPGFGVYASNDALETRTLLAKASDAWPNSFDPVRITAVPSYLDVFVGTCVGEGRVASVRLTRDNGASFTELASGFHLWGITVPIFSEIGPLIMSQGSGILFSFDQGATWFTQNQGLEDLGADGLFTELVGLVWPRKHSRPVVATEDSVFSFRPDGWVEMAGPGAEIRALAVRGASDGGSEELLLAATNRGVWAIPTRKLMGN